jgi:hypothetical protein
LLFRLLTFVLIIRLALFIVFLVFVVIIIIIDIWWLWRNIISISHILIKIDWWMRACILT